MCLINLMTHVLTRPMKGTKQMQVLLLNKRSSVLCKSRHELLKDAVQKQCHYALFIDTDQTFSSDLLYRLLSWQKPVVACNIATKAIPSSPTARSFNPNYYGGDVVFTDPASKGLQQVWRIGTGVMLIELGILAKVPKPWFLNTYKEDEDEFGGEDWYFCEKLEKAGIPLFIDHDASKTVGHIGKLTYTHELVGEVVKQEAEEIKAAVG